MLVSAVVTVVESWFYYLTPSIMAEQGRTHETI